MAVKSHQTETAIREIKHYIKDNTIVISLQNGIDNGEIISKYISDNIILLSALKVGLSINYAGDVIHTFGGELKIGCYKKPLAQDDLKDIVEMFKNAGIKCTIVTDIKKALWEKLIWNAAFNPLSVLIEKTCGQLIENEKVTSIMENLMEEVIEAAMVDDVFIDKKRIEKTLQLENTMKTFKTSMFQDIEALKRPEIDGILLPVINRLEKKGNFKSYHRLLYNLIEAKYGGSFIYTPKIAADTIVINSNKEVLLIKRKNPPYGWAIPGGFVDYNERVEEAANREICEETGLQLDYVNLFGVYSSPDRDIRGHTVSVVYYSYCDEVPRAGDDAKEVCFFSFQKLPDLAFDHSTILKEFYNKVLSLQKS